MSGKGDKPRPYSVPLKEFDQRWDAIFGKKKKSEGDQQAEAFLKDEYYDLEQTKWDAYSGLPNPDAYRKDNDASKS